MSPAETVHASVAVLDERGVLIRGEAGSGKSSLLLALIYGSPPATLVADDRVHLAAPNGKVVATVPDEIAGRMEIRGQGIVERPYVRSAVVDAVIDLLPREACPRMPAGEEEQVALAGTLLPRLMLPIGAGDGAIRVRAFLDRVARRDRR